MAPALLVLLFCVVQNVAGDQVTDATLFLYTHRDDFAKAAHGYGSPLRKSFCEDKPFVNSGCILIGQASTGKLIDTFCRSTDFGIDTLHYIYSASKWVTAVTLLKAIDTEELNSFRTTPLGQIFDWWTSSDTDNRSQVTLENLLAFTSGLDHQGSLYPLRPCTTTLELCARKGYEDFSWVQPGTQIEYGNGHLTIAVAAVEKITGRSFSEMLSDLASDSGIDEGKFFFDDSVTYQFPLYGGGMKVSAFEYFKFMKALITGKLLSPGMLMWLTADHSGSATAITTYLSQEFYDVNRYAQGNWVMCNPSTSNSSFCDKLGVSHSLGFNGFLPFWDHDNHYFAIMAPQANETYFLPVLDPPDDAVFVDTAWCGLELLEEVDDNPELDCKEMQKKCKASGLV